MRSIESPHHELSELLKSLSPAQRLSISMFLGIINQHALTNSQDAKLSTDSVTQSWRNLPLMESPSSKVDGRPIPPNPGVSEPYFSGGVPKPRGPLARSRTRLVLLRRELEEQCYRAWKAAEARGEQEACLGSSARTS